MNREYKRKLFNSTFRQVLLHYCKAGLESLVHSIPKLVSVVFLFLAFLLVWNSRESYFKPVTMFTGLKDLSVAVLSVVIILFFFACFSMLLIVFGLPKHAKRYHDSFQRCNMINSAYEAPALLECKTDEENQRIQRLVFLCKGLPLSLWQDNKEKIESALNISIDRIEHGKNNQQVIVYCVDGKYQLPDKIEWSNEYLSHKGGFTLVLGESIASRVEVDLARTPHVLIGGSTGSGKTLLLKLMLLECILKGAKVYIADFKGGVDFNKSWKSRTHIITEPEDLAECLDTLVEELHRRKRLLAENDCANIDEYNHRFQQQLPRLIFACDEVAELLDATGLGKKEKEQIQRYTASINTLVRLGRAMSIHAILSTQRADAQTISGQIKSNLDVRICGRADDVLSKILLDKTDANDLISKTAQGRFLTNTDVLFQAYYFDDKKEW